MGGWELFFTGLGNVLEPFNFSMMVTGLSSACWPVRCRGSR